VNMGWKPEALHGWTGRARPSSGRARRLVTQ
jgi:hypothetical protein